MIAQLWGLGDDAVGAVWRHFRGTMGGPDALKYENPDQMINALHNPWSEASAVARMQKMHYGEFYKHKNAPSLPFGPREQKFNSLYQRTAFSDMAERELKLKGKGWGGVLFGRPVKGLNMGISHLKANVMFAPLTAIYGGYTAPKGHKMSGFIGGAARTIAFGVGDAVGTAFGGPITGLILGSLTEELGGVVQEGIQSFNEFGRKIRHVNMGGDYEDTRVAYTQRQRAAQEMGSSVMNARTWLGKEAVLLHQ